MSARYFRDHVAVSCCCCCCQQMSASCSCVLTFSDLFLLVFAVCSF